MDRAAVTHHLVELIDGDDLLKRAQVSDFIASLREIADTTEEILGRGISPRQLPSESAEEICSDEPPPLPPGVPEVIEVEVAQSTEPPPLPPGVPEVGTEMVALSFPALSAASVVVEWTGEQLQALDRVDDWEPHRYGEESDRLGLFGGGETTPDDEVASHFFALTGPAGTGKSTLAREVVSRYGGALTAMTGRAALRLQQVTGSPATTLHKVLYYPPQPGKDLRFVTLREPPSGFVIVDEASMLSPPVFEDMKRWAIDYGTRFLLVGDSFQLPPVITGKEAERYGEDFSVFSVVSGAALQTVMRNAGGVLQAATCVRETGEVCSESILDERGGYEYVRDKLPIARAVEEWLADSVDHLLITWKNSTRMTANRMIRERLGHSGPLPDEGEPVLLRRNGQGYLNGEVVTCGGFTAGPSFGNVRTCWLTVGIQKILVTIDGKEEFFDGLQPAVADWKKYNIELQRSGYPEPIPVTWGYCLTAHAAQGSQGRRATVFLERSDLRSNFFNRLTTLPGGGQATLKARWVYTATTRSTTRTMMVVGR